MAGAEKIFRIQRSGDDNFSVRTYAPVEGGTRKEVIFGCDRISYLFDGDEEGTSRIRLDSGIVLPVRLSLAALHAAIRNPKTDDVKEGNIIDLTAVTDKDQAPVRDLPVIIPAAPKEPDVTPKIVGDVMKDGTIYAGISPLTGQPLYVVPKDAPAAMSFNEAAEYLREFEMGGKKDFRLPTKEELAVIYKNKDKGSLKRTFNESSTKWYWTATPANDKVFTQRFTDGYQYYAIKESDHLVRCVRSPAKKTKIVARPF